MSCREGLVLDLAIAFYKGVRFGVDGTAAKIRRSG